MDGALPTTTVTGLVLCRAASHRFAFIADQVSTIEPYRSGAAVHANVIFDAEPTNGKIVRHASGLGVGVDTLEVNGDDLPLLPAPRVILGAVGGSLYGFVSLQDLLYPVLRLSEFARYLASQKTVGA